MLENTAYTRDSSVGTDWTTHNWTVNVRPHPPLLDIPDMYMQIENVNIFESSSLRQLTIFYFSQAFDCIYDFILFCLTRGNCNAPAFFH